MSLKGPLIKRNAKTSGSAASKTDSAQQQKADFKQQNVRENSDGILKRFQRGENTRTDVVVICMGLILILYLVSSILSWVNRLSNWWWSWDNEKEQWRQMATACEAKYFSQLLNVFLGTCCLWLLYLLQLTEQFAAVELQHVLETKQAENERDVAIAEKRSQHELLNYIKERAEAGEEEIRRMQRERRDHQNTNSYKLAQGLEAVLYYTKKGFELAGSKIANGFNFLKSRFKKDKSKTATVPDGDDCDNREEKSRQP